jgi:uncharacterized damage-inducible protein DinB
LTDRRPEPSVAGERETLVSLLQFQRQSVVDKVAGVDEEQARSSPVPSGTSLLWLVRHLTFAEHIWFVHRFADLEDAMPDAVAPAETLAEAVDGYRAMWARVDDILAGAPDLDEVTRRPPDVGREPVNLRWILGHMLEETARHAGHADILAELLDGRTGR